MAAPGSALDVVNLALLKIYAKPITSLTDLTNKAAIIANAIYDQYRRELLSMYSWNFAKNRATAALSPVAPAFDYQAAYQMPNDLLRLLEIRPAASGVPNVPSFNRRMYDIQGRQILMFPIWWGDTSSTVNATTITGISQSNPCTVVAPGHTFNNGDEVQITAVNGMTQLNGNYYLVANPTINTFQIQDLNGNPINSTGYTAYASGGLVQAATPTAPATVTGFPPASINLLYIQDSTDVTTWSALFVSALATRLAIDLCMPITGSSEMSMILTKAFDLIVAEAQGVNFQEKPMEVVNHDPIAASRNNMSALAQYPSDSWGEWGGGGGW